MAKALLATLPTPPTAATARRPGTTSSTSTWVRRCSRRSLPPGRMGSIGATSGTASCWSIRAAMARRRSRWPARSTRSSARRDPATNNGQAVTSVTLKAADDLVLTR